MDHTRLSPAAAVRVPSLLLRLLTRPANSCPCRRRPHLGADGWFRSVGDQQQQEQRQQEPGLLHSLSDFLDSMGSIMAALGLFSQVRSRCDPVSADFTGQPVSHSSCSSKHQAVTLSLLAAFVQAVR
jgi:hypothetical protein